MSSSPVEFLEVIEPLSDPVAHGTDVGSGVAGLMPAMEAPDLLTDDLRAFFSGLPRG